MLALRRRLRAATLPLVAALGAAALACDDGPTGPRVGDIVLQPAELRLRQKEVHRLNATVTDASGTLLTGMAVTFASTNERIVTVSALGEVTSVGPAGSAMIRVTSGGFTKNLPVVVEGIMSSIRITPSPATLSQKGTLALQAKALDLVGDEMAGVPLRYVSSNPALITVTPGGEVTSVGPHGSAYVEVHGSGLLATVDVTVTQVASGMQVGPSALELGRARTSRLRAWVVDLVGAEMPAVPGAPFTFVSSNPAIVAVEADGTLRASSTLGEATITVGNGTWTQTVPMRVVETAHPSGQIAGTIAVPSAYGVAFAHGGQPYAVSNGQGVFRLDLDASSATMIGETSGLDLAITADGGRAYVAETGSSRVSLVELATGAVLRSSPTLDDAAFTNLLSADDATLWVGTDANVTVLDAATLAVRQTIPANAVVHLARHPTQPYVYASSNGPTVQEIDMGTRAVRRTFTIGAHTQGMVVSRDGTKLYVADEAGPMHVVDLASGTVVARIEIGGNSEGGDGGYGLAMSPDGLRLYVTLSMRDQLVIVDPQVRSVVSTLAIPGTPRRLTLDPSGTVLLVASEDGTVTVIR